MHGAGLFKVWGPGSLERRAGTSRPKDSQDDSLGGLVAKCLESIDRGRMDATIDFGQLDSPDETATADTDCGSESGAQDLIDSDHAQKTAVGSRVPTDEHNATSSEDDSAMTSGPDIQDGRGDGHAGRSMLENEAIVEFGPSVHTKLVHKLVCYDPEFMLPLLQLYLEACGEGSPLRELVEVGAVGFVLMELAARSVSRRTAGCVSGNAPVSCDVERASDWL